MPGILDRTLAQLSTADIKRLIEAEVAKQVPAFPKQVLALSDKDKPVIHPPVITDGQVQVWDASQGKYVSAGLSDITGKITSTQITDHSISTPQLDANLVLAGTFATGTTNPRVVVNSSGITIYDASGTAVVIIPAVGTSTFNGNIQTANLQINGNMTISGTTNVMNQASQLTLNEGFQDPTAAPVVNAVPGQTSIANDVTLVANNNDFYNASHAGMVYNTAGGTGGATKTWSIMAAVFNEFGAHTANMNEFDASTGAGLRNIRFSGTWNASEWIGAGVVGSNMYCGFVTATNKIRMLVLPTATWTEPSSAITLDAGPISPTQGLAFASDGTDLFVIDWAGTGASKIRIRKYDTTGTLLTTTTTTGGIAFNSTNTPTISSAAWDGTNWWVHFTLNTPTEASLANNNTYIEKYLTGAYVSGSKAYYSGDVTKQSASGMANAIGWDSTNSRLCYMANELYVSFYSGIEWTAGTDKWYFGYRWNDGSTGHTLLSPLAVVDMSTGVSGAPAQRLKFQGVVPAFPSGVASVDWYTDNAASTPAKTAMRIQSATTYVDGTTSSTITQKAYNASGTVSPETNTFAGGTSSIVGTFSVGNAPWKIGGDGQFRIPSGNNTQRASIPTTTVGQLYANSSGLGGLDFYAGTLWRELPRRYWSSGGEGLRDALYEAAGVAAPAVVAQNYDPFFTPTAPTNMTTGNAMFLAVYWPGGTMTGIKFIQQTQGVYTDSTPHSELCLYSYDGTTLTKVSGTSNTTGGNIWKHAAGIVPVAFSSPFPTAMAAGIYYIGALYFESAHTTVPKPMMLPGAAGFGNAMAVDNPNTSWPMGGFIAGSTSLGSTQLMSGVTVGTQFDVPWFGIY